VLEKEQSRTNISGDQFELRLEKKNPKETGSL